MIQSFQVPTDQVAKWAGLMSAAFSLSQCLTGIAWGRASDRFGRKPMILLALTCTMISSVLFGFSRSLVWAFVTRSLQGLSNGNVGIIRTAVAELVPQKQLQPLAFSIMPLVWTVGSIFGPSFGGTLVHPVERYPGLFRHLTLLKEYPFALPNLLISLLFLIGITSGILFLHETLEDKKSRRDYGLVFGSLLTRPCSRRRRRRTWRRDSAEADPFLPVPGSELSSPVSGPRAPTPPQKSAGWHEVFSPQSNINLAVYTFLAMHSVAFDQLLPIFMHHPVQSIRDPAVHLPLKFAGGFGIDSNRIGVLFTIYGVFGMIIQFAIFPPFARKYGVLNCLKACAVTFPLVYVATPFTALLPTDATRQGAMLGLMMMKGFCGIFAFPCSTILLTNSAASLKVLGTLNGVATSISAVGRATGPALAGATFTGGIDIGYVIISWWTLAVIAIIGAVPVWFLIETEGFGGGQDGEDQSEDGDLDVIDEEDDNYDDDNNEGGGDGRDDWAKTSAIVTATKGHPRRTGYLVAAEEDDVFFDEPEEVPAEQRDFFVQSPSKTSRSLSHSHSYSRRASLILQRIPSPIGMGAGVVPSGARRYSSDLGATRSGFGTGGTSFQ